MSESLVFTDQNTILEDRSRECLWDQYPSLKHRLVVFDHAEPLLAEILSCFSEASCRRIYLLGTPGIGKSSIRNIHAHILLRTALKEKKKCMVIKAKGGQQQHVRLCVDDEGSTSVIIARQNPNGKGLSDDGFKPGESFFCLADISGGNLEHLFTDGACPLLFAQSNAGQSSDCETKLSPYWMPIAI